MLIIQSKFETLLQSWELRLQDAEARETDVEIRLKTCIRTCEEYLIQLRQWVTENTFADKDSEIYFFKKVKPAVMARYIYYRKVYGLHFAFFNGSGLLQKERLTEKLQYIARYFDDNRDMCTYYREGCTHHDEVYFVRGINDWQIFPEVYHFDMIFCTGGDLKLAELMAHELLLKYIDGLLEPSRKMIEPTTITTSQSSAAGTLPCTASNTDIVELGYALFANGSFNNGKASIKDIMNRLSDMLRLNLQNYSHTFFQIRE